MYLRGDNVMTLLMRVMRMALAIGILWTPFVAPTAEVEHREHGAHEHGHGMLSIVIDGDELAIELELPGVNVVGFEHEPSNQEQRRAVEETIALFKRSETLFILPGAAGCRADKVDVTLAHEEHHNGNGHSAQALTQDKKAAQADDAHEVHSELRAEYHFHCNTPTEIDSVEVRLFGYLIDLNDIEVQIVTPTLQTATELDADNTIIKLVGE
jgi:hypothetical protein